MDTQDNNQQGQQNQQTQPNQQQQYQQSYQQQPYQQQPYQQPIYVVNQPAVPQKLPASPEAKEASFSAGSSIFMLILCIVGTLNLISSLVGKVISLNIGGLLLYVLEILIVVGMWITFANAKKKKLSTKGISLIKVPYIIQFVFSVFSFVGNLILWFLTLNIIKLVIGTITFIINCICFSSINKTLQLAYDINCDKSVANRKAGVFSAVIMIISAAFTLISDIVGYVTIEAIKEALANLGVPKIIMTLLAGGGVMTIVVAAVTFVVGISGAIVMLQFGKKVKEANEIA